MTQPSMILLAGFLYIVLFGGLSWMRREGLSTQLAGEALAITALVVAAVALFQFDIHPAFFLFGLYIITMRVRLLVDFANMFARRRQFGRATAVYDLAGKMFPDQAGQLIIQINRGILSFQQGDLDKAIKTFESVLNVAKQGACGLKQEAAAHYNLGVALLRKGQKARATVEFNEVMEILPTSEYARRAEVALERSRKAG
jgi:tetratricopeptide (TPR) repeat protein